MGAKTSRQRPYIISHLFTVGNLISRMEGKLRLLKNYTLLMYCERKNGCLTDHYGFGNRKNRLYFGVHNYV